MALRINDTAPDFSAEASTGNFQSFHSWMNGQWTLFFSHPADFTPVCTTELGQVAKLHKEFESRKVKVIALSTDSAESHRDWIHDINETQSTSVQFPIIADPQLKVSKLYGMLDSTAPEGMPMTVRSAFFIDPKKKIRAIISYPASTGRNFNEILRVIDSLQLSDNYPVATPADWKMGDPVIVRYGVSEKEAQEHFGSDIKEIKPYLKYTSCPKNK